MWMNECAAGQPRLKAERRMSGEHSLEEVGARLRGMMPWIAENALVDKSKKYQQEKGEWSNPEAFLALV